jgi:hypothetical protein
MPQTRSLRATLESLAHQFASSLLEVVRTAPLEELVVEATTTRPPARARTSRGAGVVPVHAPAKTVGGRLARRSPQEIERTLGLVVAAVKGHGMRAEELQRFLSLDKRELPRVLALGISKKVLKKSGQKRATVYSAS